MEGNKYDISHIYDLVLKSFYGESEGLTNKLSSKYNEGIREVFFRSLLMLKYMKKLLLFTLPLAVVAVTAATIDLNNPDNYANQSHPAYINKDNTQGNLITDKGATLGRVLFYDKHLSVNNTTACANCHQQQFAFSDTASASVGVNGNTGRHSMRLINARFANERRFFWDERATTLEEQTTMPIQDHAEMGFSGQNGDPDINDLITKMNAIWYYPQLFQWVYGDTVITEQRMQNALAQFVRSIQSFDSKFDAGRATANNDGQPFQNFTQQENQGKQLFLAPPQFDANGIRTGGGAGCAGCHRPPEFDIDPQSGNNGIIGQIGGTGLDFTNTRSPSLRDAVDINGNSYGGFMHTAGFNGINNMIDVINHYDSIRQDNPNLDNRLKPGGNLQRLRLTTQEKSNLVAFLRTLTGSDVYTNAKWSDPFTNDSLTLVPVPTSVEEAIAQAKVTAYPTVASTYVRLAIPNELSHTRMVIASSTGQVVYQGLVQERVNVSSYAAGMYIFKFENGQSVKIIKR